MVDLSMAGPVNVITRWSLGWEKAWIPIGFSGGLDDHGLPLPSKIK